MGNSTPVSFRTVKVVGVEGSPEGLYVFAEDVLNMMAVIGMAKGVNLSKEITDFREGMSSK